MPKARHATRLKTLSWRRATRDARRPIVLFTEDNDTSHVKQAIAADLTAYVVAGLTPDRVKPVLEVALARFEHEESIRRELAAARSKLSGRKVIDRAKGILSMQGKSLGGHHETITHGDSDCGRSQRNA